MSQRINGVYYPSWRVYKDRPPSSLDLASITHIFYAFVSVNEDGTLQHTDEWADTGVSVDGTQGCLPALAKIKREHPHIKTVVSLGGATCSGNFAALAADEEARWTLAQQIREFCDRFELSGVDIDWEHPNNAEQGANFVTLLATLRLALPSPDYLVTTALPVGEYCLKNIDLVTVAEHLDLMLLMSYDFTGGWTDVCGHHAQLLMPPCDDPSEIYPALRKSCQNGVDYVLSRGFPASKVILGIPAYARYFGNARAPGQPFEGTGDMEYCDIPENWVANARIDETVGAASFVDVEGGKGFLTFDVPATVRIKARYAKAMELGGLFYWHGAGDRSGEGSLVAAGWEELQRE